MFIPCSDYAHPGLKELQLSLTNIFKRTFTSEALDPQNNLSHLSTLCRLWTRQSPNRDTAYLYVTGYPRVSLVRLDL